MCNLTSPPRSRIETGADRIGYKAAAILDLRFNIILGQDTPTSGSSVADSVLSTFTQASASGTVQVQTLTLGDKNSAATSFPMTTVYNLNAGT